MDLGTKSREEVLHLLESILGSTPDFISLLDEKGDFQFINRTVPGLVKERVLGTNVADYSSKEYQGIIRESVQQCLLTGAPVMYHTTATGPNSTLSHYLCRLSVFTFAGQRMILCVATDVTEFKNMEYQLRMQIGELETLNSSMVDREVKMAELKSELEAMKKRSGH